MASTGINSCARYRPMIQDPEDRKTLKSVLYWIVLLLLVLLPPLIAIGLLASM
jgi:hypothetical protein